MHKSISKILGLCIVGVLSHCGVSLVQAGGGRIEVSSSSGVANGSAAQLKALIYVDNEHTQPSSGEQGTFSFQNPASGQSCTTPTPTSNSQGEIIGSCSSSSSGQFSVLFKLSNGEERVVAVTFSNPPTPTPSPQNISGSYTLELSHSNISFSNEINTGFGVNATLRDGGSREVVTNQSEIEYVWASNRNEIVKIREINALCIAPVQAPCPRVNAQLEGYTPGSTTLTVSVRKAGQTLATAALNVTITQASSNARSTSVGSTPTPQPTPTLTPSPSPILGASPRPTPTVTPSPKVTPTPHAQSATSSNVLSPDAGGSADTELSTVSSIDKKSQQSILIEPPQRRFPWELLVLSLGILFGFGVPVGWFIFDSNPKLKIKFLHEWQRLRRFFPSTRNQS